MRKSRTTVWQPTYELGMLSARMLMKRIQSKGGLAGPRTETLYPELVVRGSSR